MSQDTCETIVVIGQTSIDNPEGLTVINKSDFDPEKHKLPGEAEPVAEKPAEKTAAPPAPAPINDKPWAPKQ